MFGNKYVAFSSPEDPVPQRITSCRRDRCVIGDHRVQHLVRDRGVDRGEGGSGQAEPDADRDRPGAGRVGRSVRPVAHQRQRHPGRSESADAPDPPRHPAVGRSGRRVRRRRPGPVGRSGERGDHRAHAQRAAGQSRSGVDGLDRVRQHRWRHLRARRARIWCAAPRTSSRRRSCSTSTAPRCSARSATSTTSNPRSPTSLGGNGYSLRTHSEILGARQSLRLSGQPAAGQRQGRTGRPAGLLAAGHPRSVAARRIW